MKLEYKALEIQTEYNSVQSYATRCNPLNYTEELIYSIIQNKASGIHFQESIIYMQVPTGHIFDRLINHSLVGASYDEPPLRNQAFRLIVSNVETITSLSPPPKGFGEEEILMYEVT